MANNVSIATRPLVYSTFRYINNKVWNALAEYIDNSIQSFNDHKTELKELNTDGKLHVRIDIDFVNDTITILDDAYGIAESNYQRAFELANLPLDNQHLNEFGMGMKVSSIWLSNTWTVETSAYGEAVRKIMTFDLKEVVENEEMELPVTEIPCEKEVHFTKITLSNLSMNKPTNRQLAYVKKHLASIYTQFLRDGDVEIMINEDVLEYTDLKYLKAAHYSKPDGEAIDWIREINFEANLGQKKYSVKGFIGILETMSTSENNGFLLFRRGRVIGTSYDDRYRPKLLCGQEGSPQYKRIYGELHLEGFDVSFTKNSFQEDDDFSMFIELLKEDLTRDKSFDIFNQAQNYVKPKSKGEIKNLGAKLINQIAKGFTKPIEIPSAKTTPSPVEIEQNRKKEIENSYHPQQTQQTDLFGNVVSTPDELGIQPITIDVTLSDGKSISLTIKGEKSSTEMGLYTLTFDGGGSGCYTTTINLRNPMFEKFSSAEGQEQLAYFIKVMVATEISLTQGGEKIGCFFRNTFNTLFGTI